MTEKTLRDEFAMAALTGLLARAEEQHYTGDPNSVEDYKEWLTDLHRVRAEYCYRMADSMIEARSKGGALRGAAPDMHEALDRIFSLVSYVNIHGVGSQPEPSGEPQVVRVSPEEFSRIFQEIGKIASVALSKAESQS